MSIMFKVKVAGDISNIVADSRIVVKVRAVDNVVTFDFTGRAKMFRSVFSNDFIDRNLVEFLNLEISYNWSWSILINVVSKLVHFELEIIII